MLKKNFMPNALVFVGKYSPVFMGILDVVIKNEFDNFIFIDTSPTKSSLSKGLCKEHFHKTEVKDIHSVLLNLGEVYSQVFCLTLSYNDTLNLHKLKSKKNNINILGANANCIDILLNKEKMNDYAKESRLPLLPNINVTAQNVEDSFPLVLRPKNEKNATFKAEYVSDKTKLQHFLSMDVVAQPFISGPTIVIHILKLSSSFTFECFIARNKYEGVTLTLEKYAFNNDQLILQINNFLDLINFTGVGHFEFIQDDLSAKCYFLDFNGRFGGTSLKAAALGFNEFFLYLSYIMPTIFKDKTKSDSKVASNTLSVLKCIKTLVTKEKSILDYPVKSKTTYISYLIGILFTSKNELNFPNWRITKDYFVNLFRRKFSN